MRFYEEIKYIKKCQFFKRNLQLKEIRIMNKTDDCCDSLWDKQKWCSLLLSSFSATVELCNVTIVIMKSRKREKLE